MAEPMVSKKDLEAVRKDLEALTKRYESAIGDLNRILEHAKQNDDRIEAKLDKLEKKMVDSIKALAAKRGG